MTKLTLPVVAVVLASLAAGCQPAQKDTNAKTRFTGEVRQVPAPPPAKPERVDPATKALARKVISTGAHAKEPLVRAHAIEAIRQTGGANGAAEIVWALADPEPVVRFAATLAAGEMRLADARPQLLKMVDDPSATVQVGVRFALHRLGDASRSHDLESFAQSRDVVVRADTAMVLGLLGEPSALNVLHDMQFDRDAAVRLQVFEAMWRLGSTEAREQLVAATFSNYVDDQAVAYLALAQRRDPSVLPHIRPGLSSRYDQIALIASRAAGMLGSDAGYALAAAAASISTDPQQRTLAAFALGAIGRSDAQPILAKLLEDVDPDVRIAAATAVLQLQEGR